MAVQTTSTPITIDEGAGLPNGDTSAAEVRIRDACFDNFLGAGFFVSLGCSQQLPDSRDCSGERGADAMDCSGERLEDCNADCR